MDCPSCKSPMMAEAFEHNLVGKVMLDICYSCSAIWFDHLESAQLSPGAIISLFKKIHDHRNDGRRLLAEDMACPICVRQLKLVHDLLRSGRFTYYRCPEGHGRLTSFFQFLREKQFIRSLTAGELNTLKAKVTQVRCSSCGAPIDVQRDTACSYCRSPISVLDAEAVEKTLNALSAKQRFRPSIDPAVLATTPVQIAQRSRPQGLTDTSLWGQSPLGFEFNVDLVTSSISALVGLLIDN